MNAPRIGFAGAGQMASAMAKGWIKAGLITPDRLMASDPYPEAQQRFHSETGANATASIDTLLQSSTLIVIAVKPQAMPVLLEEMHPHIRGEHLVISIAAGITIAQLEHRLSKGRLIRVMPNTPCLVGAMGAGYSLSEKVTKEDRALVHHMLNAVGKAYEVPEHLLDSVTGLSGSGPAFVAVMIEAMADGGVRMGLPRDIALSLAAQTVMGTAKMILDENIHPGKLKDMVTSPGGTTIAGLHAMERAGARASLMDAIEAATLRSKELGKPEPPR